MTDNSNEDSVVAESPIVAEPAATAEKKASGGKITAVFAFLALILAAAACAGIGWIWLKGTPGQLAVSEDVKSLSTRLDTDLAAQLPQGKQQLLAALAAANAPAFQTNETPGYTNCVDPKVVQVLISCTSFPNSP